MAGSPDGKDMSGLSDDFKLPKLSHLVARRLREQIVSGKIAAGSTLLPENQLLALFNVSRPTLREALRILEAEGLISIGRGVRSGATVTGPSLQKVAEYANSVLVSEGVTMRDLHEARMFFEPAIVQSLTGASLSKAVVRLRECVTEIEVALEEGRYRDVVLGTNRFHEALARASDNRALALLVGVLQLISDDAYAVVVSNGRAPGNSALHRNMSKTVTGYNALCALLEKGKTDEAAAFWRRYMERALEFLTKSKLGERRLVLNPETSPERQS